LLSALLKASPWSSDQAENKPDEPRDIPKLAALGPPETAPVGDLLAQWSPQIWRIPVGVHDDGDAVEAEHEPEPVAELGPELAPSLEAVPEIPIEAEPEPLPVDSMTDTDGDTKMTSVETEAEIALESEVLAAPVVVEPLPESEIDVPLSEASMADDHLTMIPDPVVVVDEPIGIPNPVDEASVAAPAVSSVKEVPVEDLFSGIFNVANAALRNAISLSTEVANDPKAVGGKIAARSQSLLASIKERCGIRRS
jgi:resuscitation-promoting factor RpfA